MARTDRHTGTKDAASINSINLKLRGRHRRNSAGGARGRVRRRGQIVFRGGLCCSPGQFCGSHRCLRLHLQRLSGNLGGFFGNSGRFRSSRQSHRRQGRVRWRVPACAGGLGLKRRMRMMKLELERIVLNFGATALL